MTGNISGARLRELSHEYLGLKWEEGLREAFKVEELRVIRPGDSLEEVYVPYRLNVYLDENGYIKELTVA